MRNRFFRIGCIAALTLSGALVSTGAMAGNMTGAGYGSAGEVEVFKHASKLSGEYKGRKDKFKGGLSSTFSASDILEPNEANEYACTGDRKVTIHHRWHNRRGRHHEVLGSTRTDLDGSWSFRYKNYNSDHNYSADVAEKKVLVREYYGLQQYVLCEADSTKLN